MESSTPLPGQPHIQDIVLERLDDTHVRVKVQIINNKTTPNLLIQAKDLQGQLLAEMTVIETPDEWNSYVLHLQGLEHLESIDIFAYLKNDTLGVFNQFRKVIPV